MTLKEIGAYRLSSKGKTGVITIPANLVKDSQFPFPGEGSVEIRIVDDHLEVGPCRGINNRQGTEQSGKVCK